MAIRPDGRRGTIGGVLLVLGFAGALSAQPSGGRLRCDPGNGGLRLPDGFCAVVVADELGRGRHLAVNVNGDVYLRLREKSKGGTVVALRDGDGDGKADSIERFGEEDGTGLEIRGGYLYAGTETSIVRWRLAPGKLVPPGDPEVVVDGFPEQRQHAAKTFAFDPEGSLYVNVGAPSNSCQKEERTRESPGLDPCPQLERQGSVWQFAADRTNQSQAKDGKRFATGIRGVIALGWKPDSDRLYGVQHGRDSLHAHWPKLFTPKQSAELPGEEMLLIDEGDDFGWPYCFYDHLRARKILAPEYGGDGRKIGRCENAEKPILGFPGHWAPNDMIFYRGQAFGERYDGGAFVAFHGSWDRAPFAQQGFKVVFVPFDEELPSSSFEIFADGFAGADKVADPDDAKFRPVGLAEGPDGSLYVSDSKQGRIWRIFRGSGLRGGASGRVLTARR